MSNDPSRTERDELLLIDFLLGRAAPEEAAEVERRLPSEEALRGLKRNLEHTFAAMDLLPEAEMPEGLVERAVARVGLARKTDAYLARQETARPWHVGTFSLRELLAVAASILLIVSVFVPSLRQARNRSLQNQCAANIGQLGSAISSYASANGELLPAAVNQKGQWLAAGNRPAVSNSTALYRLVVVGLAPPAVFQCPAVGQGGFAAREGMKDFPASTVSYSYVHTNSPDGPLRRNEFSPAEQEEMVILADQSPVFKNGQFAPEGVLASTSDNHGAVGQNVLYLNPAVRWTNQPNVGIQNDNIFLAGDRTTYEGNEAPTNRRDTFLLPASSVSVKP